jgi:hypothetical protein
MIPAHHLKFEKNMWRVTVDGKHYCSQTKELLKYGLKQLGIAVIEPVVVVEDNRTPAEKLIDILRAPITALPEKQDALARLSYLANQGDSLAEQIIKSIPTHRSHDAQYFTKQLGKTDFLFVTFYELHEVVDNVVLRSKLITELGNLYKGL